MPEATPPQSRHPMGRPPPEQPFQSFTPTPPAARTPSTGKETPWAFRPGGPVGRPAMVPLSQVQCHRCRGFGHYARACSSPERAMARRAPPAAVPGPPGAGLPALRPSRTQYAMAAIAGDPWGDPLGPDDTGSLSRGEPVGAAPGDPQADPDMTVDPSASPGSGKVHGACRYRLGRPVPAPARRVRKYGYTVSRPRYTGSILSPRPSALKRRRCG